MVKSKFLEFFTGTTRLSTMSFRSFLQSIGKGKVWVKEKLSVKGGDEMGLFNELFGKRVKEEDLFNIIKDMATKLEGIRRDCITQVYEDFQNDFKVKVNRDKDKLDDIDFIFEGLQLAVVAKAVMEHKYVSISKIREFESLLSQSRKSRLIPKEEMMSPLDYAILVWNPNSRAFNDLVRSIVRLITDKSEFEVQFEPEEKEIKFVLLILSTLIVETEIATAKSFKDETTARELDKTLFKIFELKKVC